MVQKKKTLLTDTTTVICLFLLGHGVDGFGEVAHVFAGDAGHGDAPVARQVNLKLAGQAV